MDDIIIWEPPKEGDDNLYVAGVDPYRIDQEDILDSVYIFKKNKDENRL